MGCTHIRSSLRKASLSESGAAMVSTGQNQGECACRKDTSLKVQIYIIANNNDNFEYALAA